MLVLPIQTQSRGRVLTNGPGVFSSHSYGYGKDYGGAGSNRSFEPSDIKYY